jgi:hypothetical protein
VAAGGETAKPEFSSDLTCVLVTDAVFLLWLVPRMLGIDFSILRWKEKVVVFTIRYINAPPVVVGGRNECRDYKAVLKKCSSDCDASLFSLNVTKTQQLECPVIGK